MSPQPKFGDAIAVQDLRARLLKSQTFIHKSQSHDFYDFYVWLFDFLTFITFMLESS